MATYSVEEILNAVYSGTTLSGTASAAEILNTVFNGTDALQISGGGLSAGTVDGNLVIWDDTAGEWTEATLAEAGIDPAGTDNSTDVTLVGLDYATIAGQEITLGQVDLSTDVTGDLTVSDFTADAGEDIVFILGDAVAINKVIFKDSGGTEVASVDSDGTISAKGRVVDTTDDVAITDLTVANTATKTALYTTTIPANEPAAGALLKVHVDGVVSNATASDDITITVEYGATVIATYHTTMGLVSDQPWHIDLNATVRSVGATGSLAVHVKLMVGGVTSHFASVETVDFTASADITVNATWDAAKAANSITRYQGFSEHKVYK